MKSLIVIAAFAASTLAFASPASAEPVRTQSVSTAGLDLTTQAGVRALDLRITHAASALCGTPSPADARGRIKYQECRAEARTAAVQQRDRVLQAARASGVQVASAE